jgi:hypothetical protein
MIACTSLSKLPGRNRQYNVNPQATFSVIAGTDSAAMGMDYALCDSELESMTIGIFSVQLPRKKAQGLRPVALAHAILQHSHQD